MEEIGVSNAYYFLLNRHLFWIYDGFPEVHGAEKKKLNSLFFCEVNNNAKYLLVYIVFYVK